MSSLVKKGTRFAPKASQRRAPAKPDPVNEPAGLVSGEAVSGVPFLNTTMFQPEGLGEKVSLELAAAPKAAAEVAAATAEDTPGENADGHSIERYWEKHSQTQTAIPEDEMEMPLKPAVPDFRRRRMSSIKMSTPLSFKTRQGSVSGGGMRRPLMVEGGAIPTQISIPLAAPSKRLKKVRNLLAGGGLVKRGNPEPLKSVAGSPTKASGIAISIVPMAPKSPSPHSITPPPVAIGAPSAAPVANEEEHRVSPYEGLEMAEGESMFIINPNTNRMTKIDLEKLLELKLAPVAEGVEVLSKVIRSLSQIPKGIMEEDPKLLEEYVVDEETISMRDLCRPSLPIGLVSSNFELAKAGQKRIAEKRLRERQQRADARKDRISLLKFIQDEEEQMREKRVAAQKALMDDVPDDRGPDGAMKLVMVNGAMVIDDESLVVDRHLRDNTNSSREKEEENRFENPVNSRTYGKARYTDKWTVDEMKQFYNALSSWGTDFMVISQLFPYRTRGQIKARFMAEERKNPYIIELALARKLPQEFGEYLETTNRLQEEFPTLQDFNMKMEMLKRDHEEKLVEIEVGRQKAKMEDAEVQHRREIEIRTGARTMTRSEKIKQLRMNETVVGDVDMVKKKRESEVGIPE